VLANLILATVDFYGVGGVTVKLFLVLVKSSAVHPNVTSGTTTGAAGVEVVELSVPFVEVVFWEFVHSTFGIKACYAFDVTPPVPE